MADPGGSRDAGPTPSVSAKLLPNNRLVSPSLGLAPPSGKSWIRRCMRPENGRFILNLNFDKVMNFDPKEKNLTKSLVRRSDVFNSSIIQHCCKDNSHSVADPGFPGVPTL